MVVEAANVGENRYRERGGRYFEDFKVGDIYEHRPGRTLTLTDNIWFTTLTMNTHPLHFDVEYAKHTQKRESVERMRWHPSRILGYCAQLLFRCL